MIFRILINLSSIYLYFQSLVLLQPEILLLLELLRPLLLLLLQFQLFLPYYCWQLSLDLIIRLSDRNRSISTLSFLFYCFISYNLLNICQEQDFSASYFLQRVLIFYIWDCSILWNQIMRCYWSLIIEYSCEINYSFESEDRFVDECLFSLFDDPAGELGNIIIHFIQQFKSSPNHLLFITHHFNYFSYSPYLPSYYYCFLSYFEFINVSSKIVNMILQIVIVFILLLWHKKTCHLPKQLVKAQLDLAQQTTACQKYKMEYIRQIKNKEELTKNIRNLLSNASMANESTKMRKSVNKDESIYNSQLTQQAKNKGRISLYENFVSRYGQLCKQISYDQMSQFEVAAENKKLKSMIVKINSEVDQVINSMQPKLQKNVNKVMFMKNSRIKTDQTAIFHQKSPQYRLQVQDREYHNNQFIIKMYKKQYKKLKNRQKYIMQQDEQQYQQQQQQNSIEQSPQNSANTLNLVVANSRKRQRLQSSIDNTVEDINKTKSVNKKINQRNKTLGDSIHNTDDFLLGMKRLEQTVQLEEKNRVKLERRVGQSERLLTQIYKKLHQIKGQADIAEDYWLKCDKQEKNNENNKQKQETLKRKQQTKYLLQKKIQLQTQSKQVSYHNLLKMLEGVVESLNKSNQKINQVQSSNLLLKAEIKILEAKLQKIKMLKKQKMNEQKVGLMLLSNDLLSEQNNSQYSIPSVQKPNNSSNPRTQYQQEKTSTNIKIPMKISLNKTSQIQTDLKDDHLDLNEISKKSNKLNPNNEQEINYQSKQGNSAKDIGQKITTEATF